MQATTAHHDPARMVALLGVYLPVHLALTTGLLGARSWGGIAPVGVFALAALVAVLVAVGVVTAATTVARRLHLP